MVIPMPKRLKMKEVTATIALKPEGDPIPLMISIGNTILAVYAVYKSPNFKTATALIVQILILIDCAKKYEWKAVVVNITLPAGVEYWQVVNATRG